MHTSIQEEFGSLGYDSDAQKNIVDLIIFHYD